MDSFAPSAPAAPAWSPRVPGWALPRGRDINETDAAFGAGIALKLIDDLIHADPLWLGCWQDRLALKSAVVAARMLGRGEDEHALCDAILLTAAGDDPGPAGKVVFGHTYADARIRYDH